MANAVEPATERRAPASPPLLLLGVMGSCAFLTLYATQPLLPTLERLFRASEAAASLTVSASTAAVALSAPFVGLLAERRDRKRVIVAALMVLAIPTLLTATAHGLAGIILWRFLQGLCLPAVFAVAIAYVTEEWGGGRVGSAMAALVTGNVVGGFSGRVVSGVVAAIAGWRVAFLTLGVLDLAGAFVVWRWLPRPRHARASSEAGMLGTVRRHLRNPRLVATYAVGFNVLFSLVATFTYVTFYLAEPPFELGPVALSMIFVVYLVGVVVTPLAGRWIDRLGSRRVLSWALAVGAAGVLLTLSPALWTVLVGLAVCSSAVFVCQSASTSYLQRAARVARSSAAGLYVSFYYLGGSVGGELPSLAWRVARWPGCVALVVFVQLTTVAIAVRYWRD